MHCRRWVRVRNCQKCTTRNARHFFILFGSFHFFTTSQRHGIVASWLKNFCDGNLIFLKLRTSSFLSLLSRYTPLENSWRVPWQTFECVEALALHVLICYSVISPINYHACLHLMLTILQCKVASESCMNASRELVLLPCYLFIHCCLQVVTPDAAFLTVGMGLVL